MFWKSKTVLRKDVKEFLNITRIFCKIYKIKKVQIMIHILEYFLFECNFRFYSFQFVYCNNKNFFYQSWKMILSQYPLVIMTKWFFFWILSKNCINFYKTHKNLILVQTHSRQSCYQPESYIHTFSGRY